MEDLKDFRNELEQKIINASKVVIVPHDGLDFDAIAASIGVALIAKKYKKPYYIVVNDPIYYKIDYGVRLILNEARNDYAIINYENYTSLKDKNDLFILIDVNKCEKISLKEEVENNKENIVIIDHHNLSDKSVDADTKFVDATSSSASEIITKLLNLLKIKIESNVANYLLSGIRLDTNKFDRNVTQETMRIVTKLLENGADMNIINEWFDKDFESEKRILELVSRAKLHNYTIAVIMAEDGVEYTDQELASAADKLLMRGINAAYVVGDIGDGIVAVKARSRQYVNVGEVMEKLSGGGNQYSGATKIEDSTIEEVGKKLMKTIKPPFYLK